MIGISLIFYLKNMESHKFNSRNNNDERSEFANDICQLIVEKFNNDIVLASKHIEKYFNYFDYHVRNIDELIEGEIPLFALYQLEKYGADNWGYSEKQYEKALDTTKKACIKYYIK